MAVAFGWGTLAASSLVIGALIALWFRISVCVIGLIMGFGAGVLISAVASTWSRRRPRSPPVREGSSRGSR
jgi:hypothetical protein